MDRFDRPGSRAFNIMSDDGSETVIIADYITFERGFVALWNGDGGAQKTLIDTTKNASGIREVSLPEEDQHRLDQYRDEQLRKRLNLSPLEPVPGPYDNIPPGPYDGGRFSPPKLEPGSAQNTVGRNRDKGL